MMAGEPPRWRESRRRMGRREEGAGGSAPLVQRLPPAVAVAHVDRGGADDAVVFVLLEDVRRPAGGATDRENRGEQLGRNVDGVEDQGGVELYVGVEVAT